MFVYLFSVNVFYDRYDFKTVIYPSIE